MDKRHPLDGIELRIMPYAHCDLAALHTRYWHKIRYGQIFDRVMQLMEEMPEFRWYFDCYRSQLQALFEKYPEKKQRFDRYIAQKKLNFIGAYANIRPNMVGEETYLRNFFIIKKLLPEAICSVYGEEVDVALGHAQIPQILRQFGYELYKVFRPNDVLDAKGIPSSFRWKGFDGSTVNVVRCDYSAFDRHGTEHVKTAEEAEEYLYENAKDCIEKSDIDLVWVNCGCDDTLPFTTNQANNDGKTFEVELQRVIPLLDESIRGNVKISSPLEFNEELRKYAGRLRTVEGILDCADVSYNIAINGEKGFVPMRLCADQLLTRAERWQVFAKTLGIPLDCGFDFETHWKNLLTACCHATQWLFEEDYQYIRGLLASEIWDARTYIQAIADAIAKRIDAGANTLKTCFNDSNFDGYRTVSLKIPCADIAQLQLEDGRGEPVDFEVIGSHDYNNTWEYIVSARVYLPAYGYNTIRAASGDVRALYGKHAEAKPQSKITGLEGRHTVAGAGFRLVFEDGNLIRINNLTAEADNSFNKLSYYGYPFYGSWWENYTDFQAHAVWKSIETVRATEKSLEIILRGELNDMAVRQTIRSRRGQERLDFSISFDWKPANAWITASIPCDDCRQVLCDIPFGTQTVDVEKEYTNEIYMKCPAHRKRKGVITAKRFISAMCGGKRVTLLRGNSDRYFQCDVDRKNLGIILLNSVIRTPGLWEEDVNDCVEGAGQHEICYSVLFAEPSERNIELAVNEPFFSDYAREKPECSNPLPPCGSLFSLDGEDVLLSSLREEDSAVFLRVTETRGIAQTISFPKGKFRRAEAVLLSGETLRTPDEQNERFVYQLKPFEIVTFRLC